jgi:sugar O-acyltransferase (sialic acid O-acetyltransferase NeuD family)
MQSSILLIGAGGHARACIDVIEQDGRFFIAGMVGLPSEVGSSILGYPVLHHDAELPAVLSKYAYALVVIGQIGSPKLRIHFFDMLLQNGCVMPIIVSPRAYVSPHAVLGGGTIVMHGAIVNAGAVIGSNCILNSRSLIEHDVIIGDHCHIATSAAINGGSRIGEGTFIGSNSSVRQDVTIGERCFVGMGQRVFADCAAGSRLTAI